MNIMATQKKYHQLREELDQLLAWFDQDQLDVDEALKKYEAATKLADQMEVYLKTAENSIQKLTKQK